MPKNAKQWLQKLDNELKTVISIYDIAKKSCGENEKLDNRKSLSHEKISDIDTKYSSKIRNINDIQPGDGELVNQHKKLATRSSHNVTNIYELENILDLLPNLEMDTDGSPFTKDIDYDYSEWCDSNSPLAPEILSNSSMVIKTANEVLSNNHYQETEDYNTEVKLSSTISNDELLENCEKKYKKSQIPKSDSKVRENSPKKIPVLITNKSKPRETETKTRRLPSPRKEYSPVNESSPQYQRIKSKSFVASEKQMQTGYEKLRTGIPVVHDLPRKIPRLQNRIMNSENSVHRTIPRLCTATKSVDMRGKGSCSYRTENEKVRKDISRSGRCSDSSSDGRQKVDRRTKMKIQSNSKREQNVEQDFQEDDGDDCSVGSESKERKNYSSRNTSYNQQMQNTEDNTEDLGLKALEIFRIISESHDRLEKMKISKDLALDMANQLKQKYDDILNSKVDLMKKLKKLEADNERLHCELKDANNVKKKLQLKIEGFQIDSKTLLLEHDIKNKEIMEENAFLRCKILELEKKHSEMMDNQIAARKERFSDCDHKTKKNYTDEDLRRVTDDKLELMIKIDELQAFLRDRQTKTDCLEEKIRDLENEIEKQKENLQQKTETLEETNKELEFIRQNSKVLEEQVQLLRKNLETVDKIHEELVKRVQTYERQIKLNEEQIRRLQEENEKLKKELENERDSLMIKNKIIDDQQETINTIREKSEEAKNLLRKNQSLERILNKEREEKLELQEAIERLKWRKEELKKKIKSLETELLLAPQDVVQDLQKTQAVLHELENQVQIKKKEWEQHLQSLIREKEQACSVAEFATKKLMQTTNEFQKQSEAHKRLHRVLAENLAEKERKLKERNELVDYKKEVSDKKAIAGRQSLGDRQMYYTRNFEQTDYESNMSSCFVEDETTKNNYYY